MALLQHMWGSTSLALVMFAVLICLSSKAVYNIWFHPLRNFPGPWYTKVSRIWYILRVFQGCHKHEIKRLHDEYGLVVRIAPDELSYIDPEAWNGIYGSVVHNNGSYPMEKDGDFFATAFGDSETLVGAKSAEYKVQKNNAVRVFSHGQLLQKGDIILSHIESFTRNLKVYLENQNNESIDIDAWIGNLILDIHVKLTIGQNFHAIDKGSSSHPLVNTMHKTAKVLQYLTQLLYLPLSLSSLFNSQIFRRDIFTIFNRIPPLGTAITERLERMDAAENCVDLVYHMANDQKDGTIDHDTIKRNTLIVILSGIETLPDYIGSVLYYTLESPAYFARLRDEIHTAFPTSEDISAEAVQNLKFLHACMNESLRMAPPFVGTLPRRVPACGVSICGEFVGGGTTVGIHNWSATHSGRFWRDPERFCPDRWMDDPKYKDDTRQSFHPFGVGPRTCVARNLVIIEASLILARILFSFDMELELSRSHDWPKRNGHLVPNKRPLFVRVKADKGEGNIADV